ncbi:sulfotransferase [Nonomuraea polychroma]|uniref:sulfotransferase n=1 Tax=Nonomuraea polychroma TaxID=46176 RepID=UPI0013E4077D
MKAALERLGFAPCYHMAEVMTHPDHVDRWLSVAAGEVKAREDWDRVFAGYQATQDWPARCSGPWNAGDRRWTRSAGSSSASIGASGPTWWTRRRPWRRSSGTWRRSPVRRAHRLTRHGTDLTERDLNLDYSLS